MDKMCTVVCFIAFGVLSVDACAMNCQYVRNTDLDGYIDETNAIGASNATSVIDCAQRCTGSSECKAFYYTPLSKECREQKSFDCPVADGDWVTGQLSNGSIYQFRVITAESTNQAEAIALCQSFGANLPQLTTIEKMDFYHDNIFGVCPGLHESTYWVDGSNSEAVNYNAPDAYTTQNGDVLHLSSGLWGNNRPSTPDGQHCVMIQQQLNYKLNDKYCDDTLSTIICEKKISAK